MNGGEFIMERLGVAVNHWGSNVIRFPVGRSYWFANNSYANGTYREIVDNFIKQASEMGVYVILDLHRYGYPVAADVDFWEDAAERYKNNPAVLFGLFNEPHGINWTQWRYGVGSNPSMQDLVEAVRSTGANNIVLASGLSWGYRLEGIVEGFALSDSGGNGIVYESHVYPWKGGGVTQDVINCALEHPVLLGEFGHPGTTSFEGMNFPSQPHTTWVPFWLDWADVHGLHWTAWSFTPNAGPTMILDDHGFIPNAYWGAPAQERLLAYRDPDALKILSGTIIGTTGTAGNPGSGVITDQQRGAIAPFTPRTYTAYFDAPDLSGTAWTGVDFVTPKKIEQIVFMPRQNNGHLMVGGRFEVSNDPNFTSGVHVLHTISSAPNHNGSTTTTVSVNSPGNFRYARYVGPPNSRCNVAYIRFYGYGTHGFVPAEDQPVGSTWHLQGNQGLSGHWNQTSAWYSQTSGGGSNPASMFPLDTYNANNRIVRSATLSSGDSIFLGGPLRLSGSSSNLYLKAYDTATQHASRIIMQGGTINAASSGMHILDIGRFDIGEGNNRLRATSSRSIDLWAVSMQGAGNLRTSESGNIHLSVLDATGYTGTFTHASGTLHFEPNYADTPFAMSGTLVVQSGAFVVLNTPVHVGGLVVNGVSYDDGLYSAASLGFSGSGSLRVHASPQTWYLQGHQSQSHNWNSLSRWYAQTSGGGANPSVLLPLDVFDTNRRDIRNASISSGTDSFQGGCIILNGKNSRLLLKAYHNAQSRIARIEMIGSQFNAASSGVHPIDIGTWVIHPGSNYLRSTAGRTIKLWAGSLQGNGSLRTIQAGTIQLSAEDATGYTGTFTHAAGMLVFEPSGYGQPFAMGGSFIVQDGASVLLNTDLHVRTLTVNGTPVAPGLHSAASLGFSGTGSVRVMQPES